ncbi:MAG TPA: pseudouridine synthase [Candidatus Dormibacteraeota bacterium]
MPAERLGRWLARSGVASRREADRLIAAGRVTVDGLRPPPGGRLIDPDQEEVLLDGRPLLQRRLQRRYLAMNKPVGVVSTARDPGGRPTVLDLVQDRQGLFPVGRLDLDSRGLILLTDDGDLALRLTHPRYQVVKGYRVTIQGQVREEQLRALRLGPVLADGPTHPGEVRLLRSSSRRSLLWLELAEGRQRQIRRMCAAVAAKVEDLERTSIGQLRLGTLTEGGVRELSPGEVGRLRRSVGLR